MLKLIPLAALLASALSLAPAPIAQEKAPPAPVPVPVAFDGTTITAVQVTDLAASRVWYAKILGSQVYYEYEPGGWCELTTPVKNSLIGLSLVEKGKQHANNGGSILSFGVRDMQKAKDWLVKNEVKLLGDVIEIPQTVKLLSFNDPDGNTLMFYEPVIKPTEKAR